MWSSLLLAASVSLVPAQAGGTLELKNLRLTIGELGGTRPSAKLLPGDVLFIAFDIEGLPIDGEGMAKYLMSMEVLDSAKKPFSKHAPQELNDFLPMRGNRIPARVFITVGLDQPPGNYACNVTVTDPKTKASKDLSVPFEVLKKDFGIVAVFTSYDLEAKMVSPQIGVVGQSMFIQFAVAGFQRDPKNKQPNVVFEYNILDEKNQPIMARSRKDVQNSGIDEKDGVFARRYPLYMNRPGKFTAKITATDMIAKKTSTFELPITVLPSN